MKKQYLLKLKFTDDWSEALMMKIVDEEEKNELMGKEFNLNIKGSYCDSNSDCNNEVINEDNFIEIKSEEELEVLKRFNLTDMKVGEIEITDEED